MTREDYWAELRRRAEEWIDSDPDPATRAELSDLVDRGDMAELADRMGGPLQFGTAGLRGRVGAGPNRMNRAVVIRTTAGLAAHLEQASQDGPVVVAFDARPDSERFAEDAVGVLAEAGFEARYFPEPTPTPLAAYATKLLAAAAGVVVTASHNPPADNGYKVYGSNAAQIIPPADHQIARAIAEAPPATEIARVEAAFSRDHSLVSPVAGDVFDRYWSEAEAARLRRQGSDLRIVYTPLHGVGGKHVNELFGRAGHIHLTPVPEQAAPDGRFPTVAFPNPEEPGALDLAIAAGSESDAELIIANDPDADRLAALVPFGSHWRELSGNEIGVLLGDYMLGGFEGGERPLVISSVVSSPMLAKLAASRDARHETTLTGFKWIANAALALEAEGNCRFVFGYEEALGYTVDGIVRDKDGLSAALMFTDLVADLADAGLTVMDRLAALWAEHGLWVSAQHSVSAPGGPEELAAAVDRLASDMPRSVGGIAINDLVDFRRGADRRPPWLGPQALVELSLGERGRILVRPSGTEPKVKVYVDLVDDAGSDPHTHREDLVKEAKALAAELAGGLGL